MVLPYYIYNYHEIELLYDYSKASIFHILNRGVHKLPQLILNFKLHHFFLKFLKILPKLLRTKIHSNIKLNFISEFLVKKNKIKIIINHMNKKLEVLSSLKLKIKNLIPFLK